MQPAPSPLDSPSPLCQKQSLAAGPRLGNRVGRRGTTPAPEGDGVDIRPEEGPAVLVRLHVRAGGRRARVGAAGAVGRAVAAVVLVVRLEDGKGLLARDAGVVGALGGLDRLGDLGGCLGETRSAFLPRDNIQDAPVAGSLTRAAGRRGAFALGVGRGWVQGREDHGRGGQEGEEAGEVHFGGCEVEVVVP